MKPPRPVSFEAYGRLTHEIGACVDRAESVGELSGEEILSALLYVALTYVERRNGAGGARDILKMCADLADKLESASSIKARMQ